ncbi:MULTISPECIES: hypothetical protein [unclassified Pseudomonas]|uniref:hypothetical protein n=1 Tax=unclassified Pseudomonas TaxID=196821 RepID=UPI002B2286E1|nr:MULTISPECIES: hypothetical protein [unclassified Pseudomonas]MEA9979486.1 hypothetical protein [Pseudomonas sp. RTS4]MEB0199976.1 hypothetical protein [Pseudomonas sp. 5S4]MEB0247063.1 hypothetical protein [Pseudomonas sp. 10S5]
MDRKKVLIVGAGNLCFQLLQMLALRNNFHLYVASRNLEKTTRLCNLVQLTTLQLEVMSSITAVEADLNDIYKVADVLTRIRPDVIVNCASLHSRQTIDELPRCYGYELGLSQPGPWLPMHLAPAYDLMRAVKLSGSRAITVNAAFPDAVNAVLDKAGLAPVIGVGTAANMVPAVRMAIATMASTPVDQVQVKIVGKHYFSHYLPQAMLQKPSVCKLSYRIGGMECSGRFSDSEIFQCAFVNFRHTGGVAGQSLTAASALTVINSIVSFDEVEAHAPGPNGLPGSYPVRIGMGKVLLSLPHDVSRNDAISINNKCQTRDGIHSINADASVNFEREPMSIMETLLGFSMPHMKLQDVHQWSDELGRKYCDFANHAKRAVRS